MKETRVENPAATADDLAGGLMRRAGRCVARSHVVRVMGFCLALTLVVAAPLRGGTIRVGLGPELPSGPFEQQDDGSFHVGSEERPVRLYLDPQGRPWRKGFLFDSEFEPVAGETVISLWEHLRLVAPPAGSDIRTLPMTDWHERLRIRDDFGQFAWLGGKFIVHGEDGFDVAGEVGRRGRSIWFDDFPHPLVPTPENPIDIWIHKELVYRGLPIEPPRPVEPPWPPKLWDEVEHDVLGWMDSDDIKWLERHPIPWPFRPREFRVVEFATTVPEPGALVLSLLALAGLAGLTLASGASKR